MRKFKGLLICLFALIALTFVTSCEIDHVHEMTHVEALAATCTEDGKIDCYYCEKCGLYYQDAEGKVKIKKADAILKATGHDLTYYEEVAATCEKAGHSAYYQCEKCGKKFEDSEATTIATIETYKALGHTEQTVPGVPATCQNPGKTESIVCSVCGKVLQAAEVIPTIAHTEVVDEAVPATCKTPGKTEGSHCSVCGTVLVAQEEIPTLEHSYAVKTDECVTPTADSNGSIVYECSVCHDKKVTTLYSHKVTANAEVTKGYNIDHRGSYTFADSGNGVYKSNNAGKDSTSAFMDINITQSGTIYFTYSVSSESGWDKFTAWKNIGGSRTTMVNGISGNQAEVTVSFEVNPGDQFTFQYSKDSGGASGSDCATLSNIYLVTTDEYVKYTLTFDTMEGSSLEAIEVFGGAPIVEPTYAAPTGYFFDGWYADEELTEEFDFAEGIAANTTIYAKYTKGLVITYANTGDTTIASDCVRPNAAITAPTAIPTQTGKYFVKWCSDEAGTTEFDFASGVTSDTTVYASWRNPVTLTFDTVGGSEVEAIATDINTAITAPTAPTKAGYRFDGWYDEAYAEEFDFAEGIEANTTVYAKWVEQVTVTYVVGGESIGTATIDKDSEYTAATPEGYTEIVEGFFTDEELTTPFVAGTTVSSATTIYVKIHKIAPDGVLSSFVNVNADAKTFAWTYDAATQSYVSTNNGVDYSKSIMTLTFAKESFVTFNYTVNSESNYDYFAVKVNGSQVLSSKVSGMNGVDITGSYTKIFAAGDVLVIEYSKDSGGNQGKDTAVISGLVVCDGVPNVTVTFDYQAEGVEDKSVTLGINSTFGSIENLASYAVADTELVHFGGWFYDAEGTQAVKSTDNIVENITVYAKYLYPATITFVTEAGESEVEAISVWTGVPVTLPEAPTKAGYIFRYWMTEDLDVFDPENGITEDTTLYSYFEELPAGATKEVAINASFLGAKASVSNATTTEEFLDSYVKIVAPTTDTYYFTFGTLTRAGGTYNYTSYAKYKVIDSEGKEVLALTGASTTATARLTEGETYYLVTNLAVYNTYKVWGSYSVDITHYATDDFDEAIEYSFDSEAEIGAGSIEDRNEKVVYEFVAPSTTTYALQVQNTGWCSVQVYKSTNLTSYQFYKNCAANSANTFDFATEEGATYYLVFSTNWTGSELTTKTIQFKVTNYPQGYASNNPLEMEANSSVTTDFSKGNNMYYTFTLDAVSTLKVDVSSSNSSTKQVDIYAANNLSKSLLSISSSSNTSKYVEALPAGDYVMFVRLSSANAANNFTVTTKVMAEGEYWTTPATLELAESMTVNASAEGYYYTFTTGAEKLWYFFTPAAGTATIYDASRKQVGKTAVQLEAETTYFYVVTGSESTTVTLSTLTEYADGKSPSGAFTYGTENATRPCGDGNYTWYYKFECTETGTYRVYTSNQYSIDTRVYVYDNIACSSYITNGYNDDDKNAHPQTTYKYDAYVEVALTAGTTYYVKVTYSNYVATNTVFVGLEKVE